MENMQNRQAVTLRNATPSVTALYTCKSRYPMACLTVRCSGHAVICGLHLYLDKTEIADLQGFIRVADLQSLTYAAEKAASIAGGETVEQLEVKSTGKP